MNMDFTEQMKHVRENGIDVEGCGVIKPSEQSADNADKLYTLIAEKGLRRPCSVGISIPSVSPICLTYDFGGSSVSIEVRGDSIKWWWLGSDGDIVAECEEECNFASLPLGLREMVAKLCKNI